MGWESEPMEGARIRAAVKGPSRSRDLLTTLLPKQNSNRAVFWASQREEIVKNRTAPWSGNTQVGTSRLHSRKSLYGSISKLR